MISMEEKLDHKVITFALSSHDDDLIEGNTATLLNLLIPIIIYNYQISKGGMLLLKYCNQHCPCIIRDLSAIEWHFQLTPLGATFQTWYLNISVYSHMIVSIEGSWMLSLMPVHSCTI